MHGDKSESDGRLWSRRRLSRRIRILGVRDKFSGNAHCCARKCFRHRQWALPSPRLHGICPFHAVYDGSGRRLFLFLGFSGRGGMQHDDVLVCRQSERPFPVVDRTSVSRPAGYAVCRRPFTAQPDGVLFAARFEAYRQAEEKLLVQSRRYTCVYLPWRMGQQERYLSGSERRFAFYLSCAHGCRFVYLRERRGALGDGLGYAELHHARK